MTKGELLNYFISQITMSWSEEEMEQVASAEDALHMMSVCSILTKAFLTAPQPGDDDGREDDQEQD